MNRLRTLGGIGLGLAIVAGAGWYISQNSAAPPAARQGRFSGAAATPVGLVAAVKGDIPIVYKALGTVSSLATVTVKTQITGQLIRVNFEEGQKVQAGDLLAEVDPRPYEVALQQTQGQKQRDEALLKNAQIDLQRYKTLVAQESIARQQMDTQAALVRQYEAALVTDQALIDAAQLNLTYTKILAPVTGRVGLRQVDKGNFVTMGDATGIVVITQLQPISVLFTIPEDSLPLVRKRLATGATLEARALDRSQKVELAIGKVATTDNQIDVTTGTVKLRATFDNVDESLFPNQFVNIRLLADVVKDAIVVPTAAIQRGQPGTFVYLVKSDDTVAIRVIETGVTDGDRVAVLKGLAVGEEVVVDGTDRLREGAKIRRPSATPPAGGTSGPPVAAAPPDGQTRRGNGERRGGGTRPNQPAATSNQ
ncbi:MAG: MdtA/MuxA family multidrug efflux RND transporter periplasmic adaptor subunit [Alphaproteobacteria bacterium]|nr:MdtA/MuxA family multidrug efflux RND transporter periplasmic adaptor subunit [Alphaproteobacteria bacterium]